MAKQSSAKGSGPSRIRLVVLEAELGDSGDVSQLTQALSNALRPQQVIHQRIISPAVTSQGLPSPQTSPEETAFEQQEAVLEPDDAASQPKKPREPRVRRPTVPRAVELEAEAVASWKAFASEREVDSDLRRCLVVAAWFHDHRANEPITTGHVYACYRHVKWPVGMSDFGAPLRKLKQQQKLNGDNKEGFTITQIGLQEVEDIAKSAS